MKSFKAYVKKEIIEGFRSYRFLVLLLTMVIFAVLNPLMLKLLPILLAGQFPEEITQLFNITQFFAVQNYIKDISQIINIVVILTLMGLLVDERQNKTLVFPYSKGVLVTGIITGKSIVYSVVLLVCIFLGFCINYYYSSILFIEEPVNIIDVLNVACLFSIYYIFIVSLIICLGSFLKKKLFVGISSLGISFILSGFKNITNLRNFLPSNLITLAENILINSSTDQSYTESMIITIVAVALYVVVLNLTAIYRMNKVEII